MFEHEDEPLSTDPLPVESIAHEVAAPAATAPAMTLPPEAVEAAITSGRWAHDVPSSALWLNTAFPPTGHDAASLTALLAVHGVMVGR